MLQPAPPHSLLNVVNNRNGVISAAPREMAAQLRLHHSTGGRAGGGWQRKKREILSGTTVKLD